MRIWVDWRLLYKAIFFLQLAAQRWQEHCETSYRIQFLHAAAYLAMLQSKDDSSTFPTILCNMMRFEKKCVASCRLLATLRDKFDRVTRLLQLAMHFSRQRCVARERWSSSCCRHFDFDSAVGNRTRRSIHACPQLARLQLGKRSAIVQYVAVRPL